MLPPAVLCLVTIGPLAALLGGPLALAVRGAAQGPLATLFDSVVFGLASGGLLLVALGVAGPGVAAGAGVAWLTVTVWLAVRRGNPGKDWVHPHRPGGWTTALSVALAAGAVVRLRSTNELAWIGDMGAYLNWANQFARTGTLDSQWPPLFPALSAAPAELFGPRFTASLVPLFGVLMLAGLVRVTGLLNVPRPIQLGMVVVAAASPHLLWFSSFPASEMLQAMLLLSLVAVTASALSAAARELAITGRLAMGLATALLTVALALNREQALGMIAPVMAVAVVAAGAPRAVPPVALRWWTGSALLGLGLGHVYGVGVIPQYWVTIQLHDMLPQRAFDLAGKVGAFRVSTAALVIVVCIAVVTLAMMLADRVARRWSATRVIVAEEEGGPTRRLAVLCGLIAIAGVVLIVHSGAGEVDAALGRIGWVLAVLPLLALLLPAARAGARAVPVLFLGCVALVYLVIEVARFGAEVPHNVYLYWDRYLTSEYLPAVLCLATVGVAGLIETPVERVTLRRLGLGLSAVAAGGLVMSWIPRLELQTQHRAFGGLYEFLDGIAARTNPQTPLVWTADESRSIPGFFPNSIWPFGAALQLSYGLNVIGLASLPNSFAPDPVVTEDQVVQAAACSSTGSAAVVEYRHDPSAHGVPPRLTGPDLMWTYRGRVSSTTWILGQNPSPRFEPQQLTADVYAVKVAAGTSCRLPR